MQQEVVLELTPEQLNQWLSQKTTRKVLQFLKEKQLQVVADWQEGNYPRNSVEEVGLWTLRMEAQCQAYSHMQTLASFLPPDRCSEE